MRGFDKITSKLIVVASENSVLTSLSADVSGAANMYVLKINNYRSGVIQGTFKTSGPKLVPAPAS